MAPSHLGITRICWRDPPGVKCIHFGATFSPGRNSSIRDREISAWKTLPSVGRFKKSKANSVSGISFTSMIVSSLKFSNVGACFSLILISVSSVMVVGLRFPSWITKITPTPKKMQMIKLRLADLDIFTPVRSLVFGVRFFLRFLAKSSFQATRIL